ncbi:hypothetical protein ACI7YT_12775 [Microbacterium sp. M]|uniref:hyaluronate lyase N-terminal domain-containing protein n=1 Tax=Microbacterium sp. M TaxID=3377125 RepID=UPI0038630592
MPRNDLIQYRRGTAAEWLAANPVLAAGEVGYAIDANEIRVGNGIQPWSSLESIAGGGGTGADGASAYEVAVANGFVGTETEWLASLVGAQGEPGADGAPGTPGEPGADGAPGTTSWNGLTDLPTSFPPSAHTQAISTVTGLQDALDAKADFDDIPSTPAEIGAATAAQGALADTAVQPSNLRLPIVMTKAEFEGITPVDGQVYITQG